MKKTLVAAITSALVIGAASTTFAAANPFSDVPADHWAFDAVATLAQEGVIEGYGDNTFNGDAHITRYEMAQMVAKAMAKDGLSAESKAMVERLAAEFADELDNLGVRVANLEKRVDNVKFTGILRLDAAAYDGSTSNGIDYEDDDFASGKLRFDVTAKVNEDWNVKGRMDIDSAFNENGKGDFNGKQLYAEGPLFGATAKLGKYPAFDNANLTNGGLLIDDEISGAEFTFGNKLTTKLTYGRYDYGFSDKMPENYLLSDYAGIEFGYDTDKLALAAGYHYLKGNNDWVGSDDNGIFAIGADYKFDKNVVFGGLYAKSDADVKDIYEGIDKDEEEAYSIQLTYKGATTQDAGSFGAWAAYRQLGVAAAMAPTYDGVERGHKGFEVGVDYMLAQNILGKLIYADQETITGGGDNDKFFARVEFSF